MHSWDCNTLARYVASLPWIKTMEYGYVFVPLCVYLCCACCATMQYISKFSNYNSIEMSQGWFSGRFSKPRDFWIIYSFWHCEFPEIYVFYCVEFYKNLEVVKIRFTSAYMYMYQFTPKFLLYQFYFASKKINFFSTWIESSTGSSESN